MQLLKNANKIKENISVNFLYSSIFFLFSRPKDLQKIKHIIHGNIKVLSRKSMYKFL